MEGYPTQAVERTVTAKDAVPASHFQRVGRPKLGDNKET